MKSLIRVKRHPHSRSRGHAIHTTDRSDGQAVVEFAVVLPAMLLLLLLAVDFGRLFYTYIAVNNAAREATYSAAVLAADTSYDVDVYKSDVAAAALRESNVQTQSGAGTLVVSDPICFVPGTSTVLDCHAASNFATGIGNQVRVSASQPFTFMTPLIGELFGGQVVLTASATGPVLNPLDATIVAAPTPSPQPTLAVLRLPR